MTAAVNSFWGTTSFDSLSDQDLDRILEGTPEHLLDVLAKLLRALLYSMELPENATEDVVGRIKERKMGRLFENQTINIPAMQREAEKLRQEIVESKKEAEESRKYAEESRKYAEESRKDAERIRAIYKRISKLTRDGVEPEVIKETVIREYSLTEDEAKDIFEDFE